MRKNVVVKKFMMGTEEFRRANYSVMEGTPQECWDAFWDLYLFSNALAKREYGSIVRNVAVKEFRNAQA